MSEETKASLKVYCVGGTGIKIGARLNRETLPGNATIDTFFIDSSDSNIKMFPNIPAKNTFIKEDGEGGGKNGRLIIQWAVDNVSKMLEQGKPGDYNVVVFSMGGGTGPSVALQLAAKLVAKKETVVLLPIACNESAETAKNTNNTIKSMKQISTNLGMPFTYTALSNKLHGQDFDKVNGAACAVIQTLAFVLSDEHEGLDRNDMVNFFKYQGTKEPVPGLIHLTLCVTEKDLQEQKNVLGLATVFRERAGVSFPIRAGYNAYGVCNPDVSMSTDFVALATSYTPVEHMVKELEEEHESWSSFTSSVTAPGLSGVTKTDDHGMLFD